MAKKNLPTIRSMTGFARAQGEFVSDAGTYRWTWEVRSLNSRGLDFKCRLPSWLETLEAETRNRVTKKISRGNVSANLQIRSEAGDSRVKLSEEALEQVMAALYQVQQRIECAPPTADGILALRGVLNLEEVEEAPEERKGLITELASNFDIALDALIQSRSEEGGKISEAVAAQLGEITKLVDSAKKSAEAIPETIRQRLLTQLKDLKEEGVSEERLAQEVTLLAMKADVREEIDRLDAHLEAAHELLASQEPIGRRFEFLVQEFNREANTLCSKAQSIELKQTGLDLKVIIDQMREQIQNIE